MNTLTKMFSFCFCIVALVFASSDAKLNDNNKLEPISIVEDTNGPKSLKTNSHMPSGDTRNCDACEFDWTAYGSECCDTAWDEFGINCTDLEANYGWDCAGCSCPGDVEECGDGNCVGSEDYYNCPEDCNAPGECDEGFVLDCADLDCCAESWIGDGFCDGTDQQWGCDLLCYDGEAADCEGGTDGGTTGGTDGGSASCESCEFDWTAYGSECCDTAWDEYGIDCATLEGTYGWDCAGCECPGDNGATTGGTDGGGDCPAGTVEDCSGDGDCCAESWIGDGFEDCADQAFGCDLTCYDNDGGDCPEQCEDYTCWDGSCASSEADCPPEPEVATPGICAEGTELYDAPAVTITWYIETVCGDGVCNGDEDYYNCPDDCNAPGECDEGFVPDCVDDDCCPESWIGDGFEDCEDQAYGCDLTCYDNDGGDCGAGTDGGTDGGADDGGTDGGGACDAGFVEDCSGDGDCCPESWIGDGFEDCEDQAFGCDLTCYDNDGGDCVDGTDGGADDGGTTGGGSESCESCEFDWSAYGSECCDTAWDEFGISCTDLEANYGWDCAGCSCPGDVEECGDGNCVGSEDYYNCPEDCLAPGECEEGFVLDCADLDCCAESWIGDGFCDGADQQWGCDLLCYDGEAADCEGRGITAGPREIAKIGSVYNLNTVKAKKGTPYSRSEVASATFHGAYDTPSNREVLLDLNFEVLEGYNAGFTNTWQVDPSLGEFTVYGFGADDFVCVTAQGCDGAACGDLTEPACVLAGALDGVQECVEGAGGDACGDVTGGDVTLDGEVNVLDIVQIVNHILESALLTDECAIAAADFTADGEVNVLDIVQIVNLILQGRTTGDASSAVLKNADGRMSIEADGYIGGVQMTLSHGSDFSIDVTDRAMVADYNTMGTTTKLVVVAPETGDLFSYTGNFTIDEMIVANSTDEVSVVMPASIEFLGAYPNPFNPSTTLSISADNATNASVMAYDITGRLVDVVFKGAINQGVSTITWNASSLPSGVYFVKVSTPNGLASMQKVMLMK